MGGETRLHWGCGDITPEGWINSDIKDGPNVDIVCDILKGMPIDDASVDCIASHHVLPCLEIFDQVKALKELYRVLKPGGVLRLGLPDLDLSIAAYQSGNRNHFLVWTWDTLSGDFITHILWYNCIRTLFTYEFAAELLGKSGFQDVRRASYRQTNSRYPELVELDNREQESFFVEGFK